MDNMDIAFKMDASAMRQWREAWKKFPYEAGEWAAKTVNDMCFQFREEFRKVLAKKHTIRDLAFIGRTIRIEKARPRSRMEDIAAVIGAWQGKTGKTFSGFEEGIAVREPTESEPNAEGAAPRRARRRNNGGEAHPYARMNLKMGHIPSIVDLDARLQNVLEESRLGAMIRMMAEGKIAYTKHNTFILKRREIPSRPPPLQKREAPGKRCVPQRQGISRNTPGVC